MPSLAKELAEEKPTLDSRPKALPVNPEAIPDELKVILHWVVWRYEWSDEKSKWDKPPMCALTGRKASSTNPATWCDFDTALSVYSAGGWDGIGIVLTEALGITGIDLDKCRDRQTKTIEQWAREIIDAANSYTEISPSGTGIRIIAYAVKPEGRCRKGPVEMYATGRYLTITGRHLGGTPTRVVKRFKTIRRLHDELFSVQPASAPGPAPSCNGQATTANGLSDDEVIRRAKAAKNGDKFSRLWKGDWSGYSSQSEADLSLCSRLAFWTGPEVERIDRLFRQSGLMRDKWERPDYRKGVIGKALEGRTKFYKPKRSMPSGNSYRVENGCICHERTSRDGTFTVALCNFAARIVEQTTLDDGAERRFTLALEGKLTDGTPLPRVEIPAADFAGMNWIVPSWGTRAVVLAGLSAKDHLRAALQLLSGDVPSKLIYGHTGWREAAGEWFYLHAAGAIGANGPVAGVSVDLPDALARLTLPDPPEGEALVEAVRASLRLLELAPDRVTVPLLASTYRAPLATADFASHVSGPTGVGKTELAALCQQHFGAGLDARHLPGSWASTGNSLEGLAFVAKDVLLLVDDFAPQGSQHDVARYHREADRLVRAQGNLSGRARCRPDGSVRPAKPPRGLILSTGEDTPRGQSLRARLFTLELSPGELDWSKLTDAQADASAGKHAAGMAGYLRWLAPRIDKIRRELPGKVAELRSEMASDDQHARTPGIAADLLIGMRHFLRFAVECGAVSADESEGYLHRVRTGLTAAAAEQAAHVQAAEPCGQFLRLVSAALASGRAHVAAPNGDKPRDPTAWGWREEEYSGREGPETRWKAQGRRIGWADGASDLYLESDAAFAEAQRLAGEQGESLPIASRTLWKRMHERKLLISVDSKRGKLLVRRHLEGVRRYVLHLHADCFYRGAAKALKAPSSKSGPESGPELSTSEHNRPVFRPAKKPSRITSGPKGPVRSPHKESRYAERNGRAQAASDEDPEPG
jgi:hypothetical protein